MLDSRRHDYDICCHGRKECDYDDRLDERQGEEERTGRAGVDVDNLKAGYVPDAPC
jgi:hypothetical protein